MHYTEPKRPHSEILQLLEICLTHNNFTFNNQWFLQIEGTAMGHRYAPFYFRYLDDIIGVWPHNDSDFRTFIETLNDHHPSINIKHTLDTHSINFLDTTIQFVPISTTQKKLISCVYPNPKSTDTHALLHKASNHP